MIEARDLTKHFGPKVAVDHLSFTVEPGRVTGFLGPNGAGKSTTMRLVLGLDLANGGTATINGRLYRDLPSPLRTVGALLEARAVHTGRSAFNHLLFLAQTQGLPRRRVQEVIDLVRHTAGAITGTIAFVIVLEPLSALIPGTWGDHIHDYLPTVAGRLIIQTARTSHQVLSAWQGFGVFCLWTAVLLVAAAVLLMRRDA